MALSQKIQNQSLQALTAAYSKKKLTPEQVQRLTALNTLAATNDVRLSQQSPRVINLVAAQLQKSFPKSSRKNVVDFMYSLVVEQMDRETDENKRQHGAQGRFDQKNIHQRGLRDQLQDHDMTLLMPKSHGNVEVLAPVNRFDRSTDVVQEGIAAALQDKRINHVVIPVGPGHWRGMYLTKPVDGKGNYQLELFDPYGSIGANAIKQLSLDLLQKCGIKPSQITIKTTGPTHPQTDGYACGDFTCAYSNKKMKEFGASDKHYNQALITALDLQGNKNDSLRQASRKVTQALPEPQVRIPVVQSTRVDTHTSRGDTPTKPSTDRMSKLTTAEKKIFTATTSAQQNPSAFYKDAVYHLIKGRQSIFSQASKAIKKEKSEALSSEELAAKLQAEEFRDAGFKPR